MAGWPEYSTMTNGEEACLQPSLPPPVKAWLRHVLPGPSPAPESLEILQSGRLRPDLEQSRWMAFSARQRVWPGLHAFNWRARVRLFPGIWICVRDGFEQGQGLGEVKLFSLITLAREQGGRELDQAALMRFLAETVWYPALLLSDPSIRWQALTACSARAEIQHGGERVALEFHFNERHEVSRIYSPGRYAREAGGYRLRPWEARLSDYHAFEGVLLPTRAEVGWYRDEVFHPVWQGRVVAVRALADD